MTDEQVFDVISATVKHLINERGVPSLQVVNALQAATVAALLGVVRLPEGVAMLRAAIGHYQAMLDDATPPGGRVN